MQKVENTTNKTPKIISDFKIDIPGDQKLIPRIKIVDIIKEEIDVEISIEFIKSLLYFSTCKNRIIEISNPKRDIKDNKDIAETIADAKPNSAGVYNLAAIIQNTKPIKLNKSVLPIRK